MISLERVTAAYEAGKPVLSDLSLQLPEQGSVAIMGPSGIGKTTLLKLLCGLIKPTSGQITGIEGRRVGIQFQDNRLLPWRSALDNVLLAMPLPDPKRAGALLDSMQIAEHSALPEALSGGMQRRVTLARAIAFAPDVLLLDEPFAGLDQALKEQIAPLLMSAAPLVIMCTHDHQEAALMRAEIHDLKAAGDEKADSH